MEYQSAVPAKQANHQKKSPGCAQPASAKVATHHPLVGFQKAIGNRAVGHLLQAKLSINEPGDVFEQEADRVAEQVIRMPDPQVPLLVQTAGQIQGECSACASVAGLCPECANEDEQVHRKQEAAGSVAAVTRTGVVPAGGGEPLGDSVRSFFEPRFGRDFSQVRVHTIVRPEKERVR